MAYDDYIPTPDSAEPLTPEEDLEAVEDAVDGEGIAITAVEQPLGRSWDFDFERGGFRTVRAGPVETRGVATLRNWIEKCLRTARGAHPIYSDDFGVDGLWDIVGEPTSGVASGELEDRITEALTVHPRVIGLRDFDVQVDGEAVMVSFTVMVRGEGDLSIHDFALVA